MEDVYRVNNPLSPAKKMETTLMHANNSEKLPVATSAKMSAVFEIVLPQPKKRDDGNTR